MKPPLLLQLTSLREVIMGICLHIHSLHNISTSQQIPTHNRNHTILQVKKPMSPPVSTILSKFVVFLSRGCGRLPELSSLKDIRGEIEINQLEKVRDATSESKQVKLNEYPPLQSLKLHWKKGKWKAVPRNGTEEEPAELVLEGLQPHSNLKELGISNYRGAKLASWMMGNVF